MMENYVTQGRTDSLQAMRTLPGANDLQGRSRTCVRDRKPFEMAGQIPVDYNHLWAELERRLELRSAQEVEAGAPIS